jgi:hypothetical protein
MIRRISPVDRLKVTDEEAKAKMVLVLGVVSGNQTISDACRESGLKAISYYKLEERLMGGMYQAALMPPGRRGRPSKDLASEANQIAAETEELRREYRRMQSLVRITRRIFRTKGPTNGAAPPKKKNATAPTPPPTKE